MKYVYIHCGRINARFRFDLEEAREEMIRATFENKKARAELVSKIIERLREKEGFSDEYQKDTDYALEHDEFWFEKTDSEDIWANVDRSVDPKNRFERIKDKLDGRNVYVP